jgi:hypothetical protein
MTLDPPLHKTNLIFIRKEKADGIYINLRQADGGFTNCVRHVGRSVVGCGEAQTKANRFEPFTTIETGCRLISRFHAGSRQEA